MSWPKNSNGGLGSAFSKQSEHNSSSGDDRPGPEAPSNASPRAANYPGASSRSSSGGTAKGGNEYYGKQGPIDVGGASHSGAYGMMRLRNRVKQMAENNAKIATGAKGGIGGIDL